MSTDNKWHVIKDHKVISSFIEMRHAAINCKANDADGITDHIDSISSFIQSSDINDVYDAMVEKGMAQ